MEKLDALIQTTIDSYTKMPTDDAHVFRVVDRNGDWTHYYQDEINRYLVAVNHVLQIGWPKGAGLIQWLKNKSIEEIDQALNSSQEKGANVHSAVRYLTAGQTVKWDTPFQNDRGQMSTLTADEWDCLLAWQEWVKVFKPAVLRFETALWNKKHLYAGTGDFIGTITIPAGCKLYIDDKLVTNKEAKRVSALLDYKTGGTYDDHKLQTAAYAGCLPAKPKGEFYTGVVRLGTRHQNGGYEVKLWSRERTKYHFERFLSALDNYKMITGHKDWEPEIVKIPLTLTVSVPLIKARKKKEKQNASPSNEGVQNKQGQAGQSIKDKGR